MEKTKNLKYEKNMMSVIAMQQESSSARSHINKHSFVNTHLTQISVFAEYKKDENIRMCENGK